jgi:hypothetical protein
VNGAQVSDGLDLAGTEGVEREDEPWSRPTGLLWPILIGAVAATWRERMPGRRRTAVVVLAAVFVFPLGYVLLHLFDRFLSLPCILLLVLGAWLAATSVRSFHRGPWVRRVATMVVCASFLFAPLLAPAVDTVTGGSSDASASAWSRSAFARWSLPSEPPGQRHVATLAASMPDVVPPGAKVASGSLWDESLLLSDPVVAGWPRVRVPGFESFRLYRIPPPAPAR